MEYIDISPTISNDLDVFPGDKPFQYHASLSFSKGDHFTLGSINTTLHIGAHVDAPIHYHKDGKSMDQVDLSYYMGDCQVIEVLNKEANRILVDDIREKEITSKRILFKTNSFKDPYNWNSNFSSLSPELIDFLHKKGVILIGIDTPSIDPQNDEEMLSHKTISKNNMAILEGVILDKVLEKNYTLMALPLKIKGADASPVRAILIRT